MHQNRKLRRRSQCSLETLERRVLLTATLDINPTTHALSYVDTPNITNNLTVEVIAGATPMLQFTELNTFDSISLSTNATNLGWTSPSSGVVTGPESSVSSVLIDTNNFGDTTIIKSTDVPITINPTNGSVNNEVDLGGAEGDNGFTEAITAQVTIKNPSGATKVFFNDAGDATARQVSITDTGVSGLTAVPVVLDASTTQLNVTTGDVASTVDISNASATKFITLEDGADDTVNVQSVAASSSLGITGINGGHDTVNIGNNHSLQSIKGTVSLDGSMDLFNSVTIDGSADSTPENVTIGDDGMIHGLTAMPIDIGNSIVTNLVLDAGTGGNTINYDRQNAAINPIAANTTINSGTGNDTVYVLAVPDTVETLTINGQGGNDKVKLGLQPGGASGTGSVTDFLGPLNITNVGGATAVSLDDSTEDFSHTVTVTDAGISGLTTAPISYSNVSSVSIIGEELADKFTVTPSATASFSIDGGPFSGMPGDSLLVDTSTALSPTLNEQNTANGLQGSYTFSNRKSVSFSRMGTVTSSTPSMVVSLLPGVTLSTPTSVIGGAEGKLKVTITNSNTSAFSGKPQIELFASTDQTLDPSATTIGTFSAPKLNLKAGASKTVWVSFAYPKTISTGGYFVLASVDSGNVAATANAVQITAPFVDLAGTFGHLPKSLKPGKALSLPLTIQNLGNSIVTGAIDVTIFSSPDGSLGSDDTVLSSDGSVPLNIKAHKFKLVTLHIPPGKTVAGSSFLIAELNATQTVAESNFANDIVVSPTVVPIA